jgi:hypothetical protein
MDNNTCRDVSGSKYSRQTNRPYPVNKTNKNIQGTTVSTEETSIRFGIFNQHEKDAMVLSGTFLSTSREGTTQ